MIGRSAREYIEVNWDVWGPEKSFEDMMSDRGLREAMLMDTAMLFQ